jgi:peptide/nickel transport system ATP-binding protein
MLTLDRVSKVYKVGAFGGTDLPAVREVSFDVRPGEVVALIGESGSGKSTIGRMILRLAAVSAGSITFDGTDVATLRGRHLKAYYHQVQGVFQDPFSSYNPIFKADHVFDMIREEYFADLSSTEWQSRLNGSLERVGLDPDQVLHKFPHQLSGGQLQRLLIARAFLLDPRLLVADEIISMLDASTRIDVLNLLGDCATRGLGVLFITHDLSLGNYVSERCIILRHGRIVEMGATARVFGQPLHPYTRNLLACVPHLHEKWGGSREGAATLGPPHECVFHAIHPPRLGATPGTGPQPLLAEAEQDHLVACAGIDGDGACPALADSGPEQRLAS